MNQYVVDKNIIEKREEDVIYLLNMEDTSDILYKIEGVAKHFWEGICNNDLDSVVEKVCTEYDVEKNRVQADVKTFTNSLVKLKIIREIE